MKLLSSLLFVFLFSFSFAQYSTPGTQVQWNLDSLVVYSNGAVTSSSLNNYEINEALTISTTDIISDSTAENIYIEVGILLTVYGELALNNPTSMYVLPYALDSYFEGIRFESGSSGYFKHVNFQYGGGIKVLTGDFLMDSCSVYDFDYLLTTGAAIEVSTGHPSIINSSFVQNKRAGISSAANAEVGAIISNNVFLGNNTSNSNRPQINMGPSGASDTTFITGNTIIGDTDLDQVGGIAFSSLIGIDGNVFIQNNTVFDNRYGIAVIGNGINAYIDNNVIYDNNTQGDPMLGGSGINFNASSSSFANVFNNTITGNLWGITVQGNFELMLGDIELLPGHNSFDNNGNNGGIYAIYNNTPNTISAYNNCWIASADITIEEAEEVIFHSVDDPSLGEVFFDPMWNCGAGVGIAEENRAKFKIYPNPSSAFINIKTELIVDQINIYTISAKLLSSISAQQDSPIRISVANLQTGIYIIELISKGEILRQRFYKI